MDKALPDAWKAAAIVATSVSNEAALHGLTQAESEIIKVRVSQLNECVFGLDLHSRQPQSWECRSRSWTCCLRGGKRPCPAIRDISSPYAQANRTHLSNKFCATQSSAISCRLAFFLAG